MITVVTAGGFFNSKYYPQVFLDECLCELKIIYKYYFMIELTLLKELMLTRQANQNNVIFVTNGIS